MDRGYRPLTVAWKYLQYFFGAANGRGHGIHSPFVYDFVRTVLNANTYPDELKNIERLRRKLKSDTTMVPAQDFGTGSTARKLLNISTIVKRASSSEKYGRLLYKLAVRYQPQRIVEMGTSLGISTAYLAMANASVPVITGEGNAFIAERAAANFSLLGLHNIRVVTGDFSETLPALLHGPLDFVFIDGNHREAATLQYFEAALNNRSASSLLIFDDIHWSAGMERAWKQIQSHEAVMLTIDLFFMGLVFFRPEFKVKQHFTIRY